MRVLLVTGPVGTVDQQDVLPAVAIVVEKGASRAESFRQKLATESAAIVLKLDSGLAGDIGEAKSECIAVRRLRREGSQAAKAATTMRVPPCPPGKDRDSRNVHQPGANRIDDEFRGLVNPQSVHDVGTMNGDRIGAEV